MKKMRDSARFAAMDIGSNTIRLLVAEPSDTRFKTLHSSQVITRLGEGMRESGALSETAMERTLSGVESLIASAAYLKPFTIAAVATHAVRSAANRISFEELFRKRVGFDLNVIEWEREAQLSLKGALMVVETSGTLLLFDIGGGSTEFIYSYGAGLRMEGTNLGVVRLAETFIKNAPLEMREYDRMAAYLKSEIALVADKLKVPPSATLAGTAGTVTSIAAIHFNVLPYDPQKLNNRVMKKGDVETLLRKIGKMTIKERGKISELENGREDLIIPGMGILLAVMEVFGFDSLRISDPGLREGVMLSLMEGTLEGALI